MNLGISGPVDVMQFQPDLEHELLSLNVGPTLASKHAFEVHE